MKPKPLKTHTVKTHKGMRIIAGAWRGRTLLGPPPAASDSIRPTSDRARTAIFNILYSTWGLPAGARVLDVCCGTGAMGLEALSRGAAHATFIDKSPHALKLAQANLEKFAAGERATVLYADAGQLPAGTPHDLIFLDPPYQANLLLPALTGLAQGGWLAPNAVLAVETAASSSFSPPITFSLSDERRYGAAKILFLLYEAEKTA